jgi:hypothetical protein
MRAALIAVLLSGSALASEVELGCYLPDGSRKVAEHRYVSSRDWEYTHKFLRETYPVAMYPRRNIVNQPGVKAVHIANTSGKGKWEGLNVYETNDQVRIYVVPIDGSGNKKGSKK